jgi:actin-related protein 3
MGYSGNTDPSFLVPTAVATAEDPSAGSKTEGISDLDFYIGDEVGTRMRSSGGYPNDMRCGDAGCGTLQVLPN